MFATLFDLWRKGTNYSIKIFCILTFSPPISRKTYTPAVIPAVETHRMRPLCETMTRPIMSITCNVALPVSAVLTKCSRR